MIDIFFLLMFSESSFVIGLFWSALDMSQYSHKFAIWITTIIYNR